MRDVRLQLRQGDRTWSLGHHDADDSGRILWQATIPRDVRVGPATLVAGTARLRIVVLRAPGPVAE